MEQQIEKKKSFKEQFLDMVAEKYGIAGAAAAEGVVKGHDKQVNQAMEEGGVPAQEMFKQLGIDLGTIEVKGKEGGTGKEVLSGLLNKQQPVSQEQPQQPSIQQNPASSPFGFGGMTQQGDQFTQQKPGLLAGLLSTIMTGDANTAANLDMRRLLAASNVNSKNRVGGSEEEYRNLEIELKKEQLNQIRQTGTPASEEELMANIPEEAREDFLVKPVKQTIRGIVTTVPIVERKKTLGASQLNELGGLENSKQDLGGVVERLKASGLQIGPGLDTRPGAISDVLGQMKGSEFASIKSDIGRNFQLYRKWATGVAAGYPELNMLAPNYPKMTDTNEVFLQKSLDVMKDIQRQREILLDHYSKGGYAVSRLRNKEIKTKQQSSDSTKKSAWERLQEVRSGK
jgi:hypothetical protein